MDNDNTDCNDMPERIWLIPNAGNDGETVWCDDPAPGADMDQDDAVEYRRADLCASGQVRAVMNALWPILGGNHLEAEMWDKISDGVTAALTPDQQAATPTAQEAVPVAARWGFDGYGWTHYLDNGSGGDWLKRATQHDDVELLYTHPPLTAREAVPVIHAMFETHHPTIPATGTTSVPVKRVECHDDGSFTAVIDYWPKPQPSETVAEAAEIERLTKAHDTVCGALAEAISRAEKAEAEIERLKPMVIDWDGVRAIMDSDDVIWVHGDDYASAVKERDEALAQVAGAFEAAAHLIECDGDALAGKMGAATAIRALTPADAQAALESYGREKVREGMQQIIDRLRLEGQINPSLTYADAIEWAEYALAQMEALK